MPATAKKITDKKLKNLPAGGALMGKRNGQTIIHKDGSLGGYGVGRMHSSGGIKGVVKTNGQKIEFQGNEVVITAPAVADTKLHDFNGEMLTNREILSRINQSGGGVSFADGGEIPKTIYITGKKYKLNGKNISDKKIVSGCGCHHSMAKGGIVHTDKLKKAKALIAKLKAKKGVIAQYEISIAKAHPKEFLEMVADQALGYTRLNGKRATQHFSGGQRKESNAKYGKALTDIAIELYPLENAENAESTTGKKLSSGGAIADNEFDLDLFWVRLATPEHDDIKFTGFDYEEAVEEMNNASYEDFPKSTGGTASVEKQTNKYKFVGALDEGETIENDYPLKDYYEDENVYELIKEGELEYEESLEIDPPPTKEEIARVAAKELESDIIAYCKKICAHTQFAAFMGSTFYGLKAYKDGFIIIRVADHYFNPDNVSLGKDVIWQENESWSGERIKNEKYNIYGFLSVIIRDYNPIKHRQSDFLGDIKSRLEEAEYRLVDYIVYKPDDYIQYEEYSAPEFEVDIDHAIDGLESEIDLALENKIFDEDQDGNPIYTKDFFAAGGAVGQKKCILPEDKMQYKVESKSQLQVQNIDEVVYKGSNFTDYQEKILFRLHLNPEGYIVMDREDFILLKPLRERSFIYKTRHQAKDADVEVRLTDAGREFVSEHKFKTQNKALGGVIESGIVKPATDYKYFRGFDAKYKNPYELNKAIEEIVDGITIGDTISPDAKSFLSLYSGYGGLEKFGATGKGLLYEYFTPDKIVARMWGLAYKYGFDGGRVLEPSCGNGAFIKYAPQQDMVTGYEINQYSYKICKLIFPQAEINYASFETLFIKHNSSVKNKVDILPKYKLVIGNPPYGEFGGIYAGMGEKSYTKAENYIDYFIFRSLDLLEKNGLLVFIIGTEVANGGTPWLQKPANRIKTEIMEKSNLLNAYRLPNGVFDRTDVLSDIIVLQKK